MRQRVPLLSAFLIFGLGVLSTLVFITCKSPGGTPSATSANAAPNVASANPAATIPPQPLPSDREMRTEDERNTVEVFKRVAPGAVFVTQRKVVLDWTGGRAMEVPAGSGSGFVWDKRGHIVTNFHVIQGAKKLLVTLQNHQTYEASLRGAEPRKDIAVLKIEAPEDVLIPVPHPPKQSALDVGQKVIAIGNPFGLDQTLTTGVVSAVGREVDGIGGVKIREMIQTDAAINPGNSGGPLLDSAGRLLGMNTMIFSRSGAWAGIGFAVPASTIARVVPQIIRTGRAEQVGIGVEIDPQQRVERRLRIRGVVVLAVTEGTPAAKAGIVGLRRSERGLVLGDVIVGIDGTRIEDYDSLYNTLDQHHAGEKVTVRLLREDKFVEASVELVRLE